MRDWFFALGLASPPLFVAMILLVINPAYFKQFLDETTRACGLPLLGLALFMLVAACPSYYECLKVIRSGRPKLGLVNAVLVVSLMTIPAIMIILLFPAGWILLTSRLGGILR